MYEILINFFAPHDNSEGLVKTLLDFHGSTVVGPDNEPFKDFPVLANISGSATPGIIEAHEYRQVHMCLQTLVFKPEIVLYPSGIEVSYQTRSPKSAAETFWGHDKWNATSWSLRKSMRLYGVDAKVASVNPDRTVAERYAHFGGENKFWDDLDLVSHRLEHFRKVRNTDWKQGKSYTWANISQGLDKISEGDDEVTRYLKACNPDWVDLLMQKFARSAGPWMLHESEVDLIYRAIQNTRPRGFGDYGLDDLELAMNSITSQI